MYKMNKRINFNSAVHYNDTLLSLEYTLPMIKCMHVTFMDELLTCLSDSNYKVYKY